MTGTDGETNRAFHFTVELSDKSVSGVHGGVTFTNGVAAFTLKSGDKVRVRQSGHCTRLVRLSKKSFCEILDKKMGQEAWKK